MDWIGRKVLVTGAGGFIGSHLVEAMVELGAQIRAFVRYNSRGDIGMLKYLGAEHLREVEVVAGDLRDADAVNSAAASREVIFHLGALVGIPYSYRYPRDVAETNVLGTINVLMAARNHNVPRIIHTSTSEVYGTAVTIPITESHPLQAQSPYAASKIAADKIAESFYRSYGLPVLTIRPFNNYGPRQSDRAVIPTIISQALREGKIHLGALSPTRDYTFVRDTVAGFIRAAERSELVGEVINIGSNQEISIGSLATKILQIMGRELPIVEDPKRLRPETSEVQQLLADNTRARNLLKWIPKVSLEEGLGEAVWWVQQHPEQYNPSVYSV